MGNISTRNRVCATCENKGCGAYHDVCPIYQDEIKKGKEVLEKIKLDRIKKSFNNHRVNEFRNHQPPKAFRQNRSNRSEIC